MTLISIREGAMGERYKVIFRKFKNGDIIALFPEEPFSYTSDLCMSYMHIGQHGAASLEIIFETKLAKPEEYKDLKEELESLGYILEVKRKYTNKMFQNRLDATLNNMED